MIKKWIWPFYLLKLVFVSSGWALEMEMGEGQQTKIFGYGELHYNDWDGKKSVSGGRGDVGAQLELHRFVIGIAHDFNDSIVFRGEIDLEHAFREPYVEYAYLEFRLNKALAIRAGSLIMPVGFMNEVHEPPTFYSVERPDVEARVIPTTWPEGGVGVLGNAFPGLRYKIYVVSGLDAQAGFGGTANFATGFSAGNGLRGGRNKAADSPAQDKAVVGRLEYTGFPGFKLGASAYRGGADQGKIPGADVTVFLWEADAQVRLGGFEARAVYAQIDIDDVAALNTAKKIKRVGEVVGAGETGPSTSIGEEIYGWYAELAYHLILGNHELVPFVRHERFNTQDAVPAGFTANPANDMKVYTGGLAYFPHAQVVAKADYQGREDGTGNHSRQVNLGVGWMF